jgi:hypothetical protein
MGDVDVSATPGVARNTSPTKCTAFSLLSVLIINAKSQYPNRLHEDSIQTPFMGSSGHFEKAFQNSPPFPEIVLNSTRYFIIGFSKIRHLNYTMCNKSALKLCDCITTITNLLQYELALSRERAQTPKLLRSQSFLFVNAMTVIAAMTATMLTSRNVGNSGVDMFSAIVPAFGVDEVDGEEDRLGI